MRSPPTLEPSSSLTASFASFSSSMVTKANLGFDTFDARHVRTKEVLALDPGGCLATQMSTTLPNFSNFSCRYKDIQCTIASPCT